MNKRAPRYLLLIGSCLLLAQCQPGLPPDPTTISSGVSVTPPATAAHTAQPTSTTPPPAPTAYDGPALIWPFEAGHDWVVNNGYNVPGHQNAARYALDFVRTDGQTGGQPALAMADGVVWLKNESIGGLVIRLEQEGALTGYYVEYLHMTGIALSIGDPVAQGQPVGAVSDVGYADRPHLHVFLARYQGKEPPLQSDTWVIPLRGDSPNWILWQPVPLAACGRALPPPLDDVGREVENGWLGEEVRPCEADNGRNA